MVKSKIRDKLKVGILFIIFYLFVLISIIPVKAEEYFFADDLRVNQLEEAYGVPADSISFSWTIQSGKNNTTQTAYRIVLAKTTDQMLQAQNGSADFVYDSGWISSDENSFINLETEYEENQLYYWCVQIQDNYGRVSDYSEIKSFSTAVGDSWLSKNGIWCDSSDYVFLRYQKNMNMENVEKIIFSVTAASPETSKQYVYNLYVNEQSVGMGPTRVNEGVLYYNTYDITDYMVNGDNVIGVICYTEKEHFFLGQIAVYYQDGNCEILTNTDINSSEWNALSGDNAFGNTSVNVGNENYYFQAAENMNSTVYPHGWLSTEYSAQDWQVPTVSTDCSSYQLEPYISENINRYEVSPVNVTMLSNGSYVVDFGKEIIGSISLHINSSVQQNIAVYYGETLNSDGSVKYKMDTGNTYAETWTLAAGQQELSAINMKTFRYVQISNCADEITVDTITGLQVRQAFDETASAFSCSNEILNDEYDLSKYTIQTTNQDMYVDTQSRERQNYSGDLLINMMSAFSVENDYTLAKHSLEYALNNPTWPAEYLLYSVSAAWEYYLYSGDAAFLQEYYNEFIECVNQFSVDSTGLVKQPANTMLVDWPVSERDGYDLTNSYYNTVINAVYAGACQDMANIAGCLDYTSDMEKYQNVSNTVKENMISKLYDSEAGRFADGMTSTGVRVSHCAQQATVFALAYGIYSDQTMADRLASSIQEDGLNQTSVYVTYFMLQGLYKSNQGTLARQIMSDPSKYEACHTWANMMYRVGATLTTESWDSSIKANMSYSHPWGSAPGSWLVRGLFGIMPTSGGYKTFDVKLQPGGVEQASVQVPTLQGTINASYGLNGDGSISLQITVPANTTARVLIPTEGMTNQNLMVDGTSAAADVVDGQYLSVQIGSGSHTISGGNGNDKNTAEMAQNENVVYRSFQSSWTSWETNGNTSGNTASTKGIYRLQMYLNSDIDGGIRYSAHLSSYGWSEWRSDGDIGSVTDKEVQAIKIELTGAAAEKWDIYYRVYNQTYGWMSWTKNGTSAGTEGLSLPIKAVEIQLVEKNGAAPGDTSIPFRAKGDLTYSVHCQTYGWMDPVNEGELAGTQNEKKRLEAIRISVNAENLGGTGGITYRVHRQTYGWSDWVSDGEDAGTTGEAKRLEAIDIKLTGELAELYDVYYRVHCETFGWLDWAKNGESAGSAGYAKRLEAIEIVLVKKGGEAPGSTNRPNVGISEKISYTTHVQTYGWLSRSYDGQSSGTSGEAKRLEAVRIQLENLDVSGGVTYRTHMQSYGWMDWVSNNAISGVVGKAKRMEAIEIKLTGEAAEKYDIYYRVHCQTYGWMDWGKNGELAGTTGQGKRLEAIEIKLVEKE